MTAPYQFELTPHAQKLLNVLVDSGETWLSRKEIARVLGKNRLTTSGIHTLEKLALAGLIQIQQRPNDTPIGYEMIYRFIEGK